MRPLRVALSAAGVVGALLGGPLDAHAQEIKLKLSHFLPAAHNHHVNVIVPWVEEVKKRTNGRVEITIFPTASLCKPKFNSLPPYVQKVLVETTSSEGEYWRKAGES